MDCKTELMDYADTGFFSRLILDYLQEDPRVQPFYAHSPLHPDFEKMMACRDSFPTDRELLVRELLRQYGDMEISDAVSSNIHLLSDPATYTVCTAHQPNLFTGYLYFVYKVLHTVKLAAYLNGQYPAKHFVPVYYMGSEDNDLDELATIHVEGHTYRWPTTQQGAVGRMRPEGLEAMIDQVTRHLGVNDYSRDITRILKEAYLGHPDIQTATLYLVNELFGRFGLVVLIADTPGFKRALLPLMREELFSQSAFPIVQKTMEQLSVHYHAQASPREVNLFYLGEQTRERIIQEKDHWRVLHTPHTFTREQLEQELEDHPERFSPNVILRGLLQETILPNMAFIGGGGELAYWLELKDLFAHHRVPYPWLMLRSSVLWVDKQSMQRLQKVHLNPGDLFTETEKLLNAYVKKNTTKDLVLKQQYQDVEALYRILEEKALQIDVTLKASVGAQRKKAICSLGKLEHKFLRAEKKKFAWQTELIGKLKNHLFPGNNLQERVENLLPFYAMYGPDFVDTVYNSIDPLNRKFTILCCT